MYSSPLLLLVSMGPLPLEIILKFSHRRGRVPWVSKPKVKKMFNVFEQSDLKVVCLYVKRTPQICRS